MQKTTANCYHTSGLDSGLSFQPLSMSAHSESNLTQTEPGVLDSSNLAFLISPHNLFQLQYSLVTTYNNPIMNNSFMNTVGLYLSFSIICVVGGHKGLVPCDHLLARMTNRLIGGCTINHSRQPILESIGHNYVHEKCFWLGAEWLVLL
jgi:hypothetical protein